MWGMSSLIIWKEVTESDELIMLLDTVSNSWHTQSVMWVMAIFCSRTEKKAERWESRTRTIILLLKNDILTVNLPVYTVGSTLVDLSEGLTNWLVNNLAQENWCLGYYRVLSDIQYETVLMYGDISFETFTSWSRNILQEEILEHTSCHLVHRHSLNFP